MSVAQENEGSQEDDSKLEVYIRFRPMNKLEISKRSRSCVKFDSPEQENDCITSLTVDSPLEGEFDFSFDRVFKDDAKQEEVYNSISPQAKRLINGYNSAIIAFGQSGTGKSHTMLGDNPLKKKDIGSDNSSDAESNDNFDENVGIIPRIAKEIFELMGKASPVIEFTVRVSYIEIYMEQIRDLLKPSTKFLKINDGEEKSDYERRKGPSLEGLSEICCLEWSEVVNLLFRANSFRIVSEERQHTDLNQSHSIFTIKIEQHNINTGRTISSKMHLVDLAGSEQERQVQKARNSKNSLTSPKQDREKNLINRSHLALNKVMKVLERYHDPNYYKGFNSPLQPNPDSIPYHESKLTRILCNALGGNCYTAFLLTASAATFNITSTISTMKFGERCMRIRNFPYHNIEASPEECNIELQKSKKIQSELLILIKEIGKEMRRIRDKGAIDAFQDGALWDKLNEICESNKYFVLEEESVGAGTSTMSMSLQDELRRKENEIKQLEAKLAEVRNARDKAQTQMLEMEGECVFLRNESEEVLAAKKRNTEDIIDAQNEIQRLSQNKLKLEHELRTSEFRENEAITYARLFRRFYRKLMQNNAAHGSGPPNEVILKMAGVPNLDDMIDIDILMYESGLIEDHELNSNIDSIDYKPSVNSIVRSSALASKAKRQAKLQLSRSRQSTIDLTSANTAGSSRNTISTYSNEDSMRNVIIIPNGSGSTTGEQSAIEEMRVPKTPAVTLAEKRIDKLEKDLLHITRRCIDLQMALNESEEWVELLTMSKTKDKVMKENLKLKDQLAKKESDMKAIVWKMNEIQIINNTYNEKLSSREEHIAYLEEKLAQLQDKDTLQTYRRQETERKLRTDVMRLNTLLDAMTRIHWQDGKKGHKQRLESRIVIPFQGGSSLDQNTRDTLLRNSKTGIRPDSGYLSELDSRDERTTAGISYEPSIASSIFVDKNQLGFTNSTRDDSSLFTFSTRYSHQRNLVLNPLEERASDDPKTRNRDAIFKGGKSVNYEPRRTSKKKNLKIMSGTLKSSSSYIDEQLDKHALLSSCTNAKEVESVEQPESTKSPTSSSPSLTKAQTDRRKSLSDAKKKLDNLELICAG